MTRSGKIDPAISKKLAHEIREIAKRAHNEEEIRIPVELALKPVLTQLGISTQANYEQKLTTLQGTGYADAVYGFGVIEYERPGKIATPAGRKEVIEQLSSYLTSKARELAPTKPQEAVKKMIGIGLDGEQIMYLRYASSPNRARFFQPISLETQLEFFKQKGLPRGGFQIVGPMPVDEASIDWLLYCSTHVLENVGLPKFDAKNKLHCHLAKLSKNAHTLAAEAEPDTKRLKEIETEIDKTAAELWNITATELGDIQSSLADLK